MWVGVFRPASGGGSRGRCVAAGKESSMRARSRRRSWLEISAITLCLGMAVAALAAAEIDHFFRVDQQVCTGGQPTPEQLTNLKAQGIRAIINLREAEEYDMAAEAAQAGELDLLYVSIPVRT